MGTFEIAELEPENGSHEHFTVSFANSDQKTTTTATATTKPTRQLFVSNF